MVAAGHRLAEDGKLEEAIASYRRATDVDPKWSVPWYNLGLRYKYAGRWRESFDCNRRAVELGPKDEAAWWNLGIAATALGAWTEARRAWRGFGLDVPEGDGPLDMDLGQVPIRINPDGNGEVTWARRIDPARAILTSVPFLGSGHRWGDVVLHDGAPNGERIVGGRVVPVFDALERLSPSSIPTHEVLVTAPTIDQAVPLENAVLDAGYGIDDWTAVRILCRACSMGRPHAHADTHDAWTPTRRVGLAAPHDVAQRLLSAWSAGLPGTAYEILGSE